MIIFLYLCDSHIFLLLSINELNVLTKFCGKIDYGTGILRITKVKRINILAGKSEINDIILFFRISQMLYVIGKPNGFRTEEANARTEKTVYSSSRTLG